MNKPENYDYYKNHRNKIKISQWPEDVRRYYNWQRSLQKHPEWEFMTPDEILESKRQIRIAAQKKGYENFKKRPVEEQTAANMKKGEWYRNLSEEDRRKHNERLKNISKDFWDGMSQQQREEFSKYRWNLKSDEEKMEIAQRFLNGSKEYKASLTKDDITKLIENMKKGRLLKVETDPSFLEKQIRQLRASCEAYWDSLSDEESVALRKRIITHSSGNNRFHAKFESFFNSSYVSNDFYFQGEYPAYNNHVQHVWDYAIYSKSTNQLQMLVDLDGAYFHADNNDYNGYHCVEEYDEKRFLSVPDNVKYGIIYEYNFTESFNNIIKDLMMNYDQFIDHMFQICRMIPFPSPKYTTEDLINSFKQLQRLKVESPKYITLSTRNREGDRIIAHFHESIYHAHRSGKLSPHDAWYNDELLKKVIRNRVVYANYLNPNKILQGFNISRVAPKVSVFSAGRAKLLIHRYLSEYQQIFDPFSGFSGRMLGAISLGKQYIGQDISEIHIRESNEMIQFLQKYFEFDANVSVGNTISTTGKYECLFTCPPYGDIEQWIDVPVDKRSCDDWIDICLQNFRCKKYLFVIDKTNKYSNYVVDTITNRSHIGSNNELVVLIEK